MLSDPQAFPNSTAQASPLLVRFLESQLKGVLISALVWYYLLLLSKVSEECSLACVIIVKCILILHFNSNTITRTKVLLHKHTINKIESFRVVQPLHVANITNILAMGTLQIEHTNAAATHLQGHRKRRRYPAFLCVYPHCYLCLHAANAVQSVCGSSRACAPAQVYPCKERLVNGIAHCSETQHSCIGHGIHRWDKMELQVDRNTAYLARTVNRSTEQNAGSVAVVEQT